MSRSAARSSIQTYLEGNVDGVTTVCKSYRETLDGDAWKNGQNPWGAVIVIALPTANETRLTIGGDHAGTKRIERVVALHIYLKFYGDAGAGVDRMEAAEDAMDSVINTLEAKLRADRRLGDAPNTSGNIWSIDDAIAHTVGEPFKRAQIIEVWGAVTFTITEMLDPA